MPAHTSGSWMWDNSRRTRLDEMPRYIHDYHTGPRYSVGNSAYSGDSAPVPFHSRLDEPANQGRGYSIGH